MKIRDRIFFTSQKVLSILDLSCKMTEQIEGGEKLYIQLGRMKWRSAHRALFDPCRQATS